jgi:hypothetical protein
MPLECSPDERAWQNIPHHWVDSLLSEGVALLGLILVADDCHQEQVLRPPTPIFDALSILTTRYF